MKTEYLSEKVEGLTFREAFKKLGISDDLNNVWFNKYSGREETLHDLLCEDHWTMDGRRLDPFTEEHADFELNHVLDCWEQKTEHPNRVVAASLKWTEQDVIKDLARGFHYDLERYQTLEEFKRSIHDRGGTCKHGMVTSRGGVAHVTMHDGREFRIRAKQVFDYYHTKQLILI